MSLEHVMSEQTQKIRFGLCYDFRNPPSGTNPLTGSMQKHSTRSRE
jgi:hypothetical protein